MYFENSIDQKALRADGKTNGSKDKDITLEEQHYKFSELMEPDLLESHSKIFCNLMINPNVVKFAARNLISELRFAFMVLSAAMKGSQGVDESIGRNLMQGLGLMLKQKESIQLINKNTYIANWFYYRLFEVHLP